jgi:hypothetical protein
VHAESIELTYPSETLTMHLEDILDVHIVNKFRNQGKTAIIVYLTPSRAAHYEALQDVIFPGAAMEMERLLNMGWGNILAKRAYPDAVKWLTAHNAILAVQACYNPLIYGLQHKNEYFANARPVLGLDRQTQPYQAFGKRIKRKHY